MSKSFYICTTCGYIGKPKKITKGSLLVEIALWFFFLIPGLIYSLWRMTNKYTACPKCNSTAIIPSDTPTAQTLLKSRNLEVEQYHIQEKQRFPSWGRWVFIVLGIIIIFNTFSLLPDLIKSYKNTEIVNSTTKPIILPTQIQAQIPSPTYSPLIQRFRTTRIDRSKKVSIQGQEIQVGELWDSVVAKLGKTAIKTAQDNDKDIGLVVEHQYKGYSILVAREPANLNYFIVWDIYPNDN